MTRCALLLNFGLCCLTAFISVARGGDLGDVSAILGRFEQTRPPSRDLTVYTLDWAPSLQQATVRAARETRPILLLVVTNSYGNLYTGHC